MGHGWFDGFWDFVGWLFFYEQVEEEEEEKDEKAPEEVKPKTNTLRNRCA